MIALAFALCGILMFNLPQPSAGASKHVETAIESDTFPLPAPRAQKSAQPLYEQDGFAKDDWHLILVNPENPIDPTYRVPLATSRDGRLVDERCLVDFERMLNDCRAAGLSPLRQFGLSNPRVSRIAV